MSTGGTWTVNGSTLMVGGSTLMSVIASVTRHHHHQHNGDIAPWPTLPPQRHRQHNSVASSPVETTP
jgi:hypothetical protein